MRRGPLGRVGRRIAAPSLVLMVLLVVVSVWLLYYGAGQSRTERLEDYAILGRLVKSSLRDAMQAEDRPRLQRQIHRLSQEESIVGVRVVNKSGRVVFADDPIEVGRVIPRTDRGCRICHTDDETPPTRDRTLSVTRGGRRVVRTVQSIEVEEECTRCHDEPTGSVLGVLITDLDEDALYGHLRTRTGTAAWSVAGMAIVVVLVLIFSIRRLVVARVRALRGLLDRLRSGARSLALVETSRDEIDDLARSLQAFVLDLDEQVALQRAGTAILRVLDAYPAPAMVADEGGVVLATNQWAKARLGTESSPRLAGHQRDEFPSSTGDLMSEAREKGWALPAEGGPGPVVVSLTGDGGGVIGFLEAWPPDPESDAAEVDGGGSMEPAEDEWLLCASILAEQARTDAKRWKGALVVDRRLLLGRRLTKELIQAAGSVREREVVELDSLGHLTLLDVRRVWRGLEWHTVFGASTKVLGARYQLRILVNRLLSAAARQSGEEGHVLLFSRKDASGKGVFLGAWSSRRGGSTLLDPPGSPRLAEAISRAHGGGVEVDPEFDIESIADSGGLRLPCETVGSLFVAKIPTTSRT